MEKQQCVDSISFVGFFNMSVLNFGFAGHFSNTRHHEGESLIDQGITR